MRTKPTSSSIDPFMAMKYLPALLLMLITLPAWSADEGIDMQRLQQQIQQRVEQASQQGAAPAPASAWVSAPSPAHEQGCGAHAQPERQNRGYGQGYERRYGQNAEGAPGMNAGHAPGGSGGGRGAGRGH